ncbi:MAG: ubiquinol-cytochrome C chaperone [Hyphomicrobiales bacterium]|nr:ubiquinol-cytochrome C chaperone [Hyphomicrobiales bacterium]
MFGRLFRRRRDDTAHNIYAGLVAQSRQPVFYIAYGVPDTPEGRFEMIVLHAVLLFLRLENETTEAAKRAQEVFDVFIDDLDGALREMGVGDLSVPKKMRRLGEAFYGRAAAYREALEKADGSALDEALARNVYGGDAVPENVAVLSTYARAAAADLAAQVTADLVVGRVGFPDAASFGGSADVR